uniref:Peptidase A1 domain-containing protein n=1 Tax=Araucaria cunninghamii TaxID=56994 RepID=A0A0D6QZC8_ARACU
MARASIFFLILFLASMIFPSTIHGRVEAVTNVLNVSHAFVFHANATSARNLSSLALPLFSIATPNPSSFLVKALAKRRSTKFSKAAAATKATFNYDDVTLMTEVMVGTPPQRQKMVLDTGSELSWLQCKAGSGTPSSFNPGMSSSYASVPCKSAVCTAQTRDFPIPTRCDPKRLCYFTLSYADGTDLEGNLARDTINLPDLKIPGFVFGCSSSLPIAETPGLMGLNRGALSFISQIGGTRKFSYCITDHGSPSGSPGVLLFGDSPFAKYLRYTSLLSISLPLPYFNRAAYSVSLEGIKVGNKMLPIPKSVFLPDHTGAGQTMIDSGTQFTLLLGQAYQELRREFVEQNRGRISPMGGDFAFQGALDLCYDLPAGAAQFPQVTPVTLLFNSAQITLESPQLLYPVPKTSSPASDGRTVYCFTFGNSDLVPVEATIIGNHHQQNLWIEYDLQNSRVGFARANCNAN